MFTVYLPIAEMPVNALFVLTASMAVGFVSGLVGVGGGFIMTPILIFMGIPPAVAVATEASQITASSVSGVLAYRRRRMLDWRMGVLLTLGGVVGGYCGVELFAQSQRTGQIDVVISLSYVFFLSIIGSLMLWESVRALRRKAQNVTPAPRRRVRTFAHKLPLRMRFPQSGLYISVLPPLGIGAIVGVLAAIMGVGGGFVLVPALIYLLRMPTQVAVGTSLFQVLIVTGLVTVLQAVTNRAVDMVLAALLISGGVVGAQLGVRAGGRISAERLRAILAVLVLGAGLKLLYDLIVTPEEMFTIGAKG
jgi:uncharacterized membrane protein YfcA